LLLLECNSKRTKELCRRPKLFSIEPGWNKKTDRRQGGLSDASREDHIFNPRMSPKMGRGTANPPEKDPSEQRRARLANELAALREKALSDLEARGYVVRGKTPAQIRRALKIRPRKKNGG
jgi:hypothetical protein